MWKDVRFALRTLRRSPGFTLLAVLSLALGIGATTAIFSLVYQVVLRSLPVHDPGSLVSLESDDYNIGWTRRDNNETVFSYPMYRTLRDGNRVFTGLIARAAFPATLAYRGEAARASVEVVTGNFFEVLGVRPALGRLLLPADDGAPGQNPVIVLGYTWWRNHLGADPKILNSRILVNNTPALVVGVAPRGFRGLLTGSDPEFFAPISMMGIISPGWDRNEHPDAYWLSVVGRLRPGVTGRQAAAMLLPLFRAAIADELPQFQDVTQEARKKLLAKPVMVQSAAGGVNTLRAQWETPLMVLMVMVGLVLLIACANVANLLIARATARQREIAIRLAVGANRFQLVRQLLVESVLLAIAGGLLGLLLSENLTDGLLALLPGDAAGGWLAPQLDVRLLGFSVALSLLTGLLFGLAPVLHVMRSGVAPTLKDQTAGMSASGSQSRLRQALIVAQICISLLLLIGAGLFTRSLVNLIRSDPGFHADHLVAFTLDPSLSGYSRERRLALFRQLEERLGGLPGVAAVSRAQFFPFGGWGWGNGIKAPGTRNAGQQYVDCGENSIGAAYFSTLGIPLLAGREFTETDTGNSPKVAILNETFARFLFEGANPIGRHILIGSNNADAEIVGVVKDSKYGSLREKPSRFLYVPFEQEGDDFTRQSAFFLRTRGGDQSVIAAARAAVSQLDANLPIERLNSMRVVIDNSIYTDRLMATLAIAFGILAAVLAAVGLYGTVSYSVARRTREFGIRLVLGAEPQSLLLSVLREVGWLIATGIAIGLPLSYVLARLAESQLFGIRAHDPLAIAGATFLIVIVALCAGLVPAGRALRIEPVQALHYE
jgi:predicted permease